MGLLGSGNKSSSQRRENATPVVPEVETPYADKLKNHSSTAKEQKERLIDSTQTKSGYSRNFVPSARSLLKNSNFTMKLKQNTTSYSQFLNG